MSTKVKDIIIGKVTTFKKVYKKLKTTKVLVVCSINTFRGHYC